MIRPIQTSDIMELLELGRKMHRIGHFKHTEYDDEKVINLFMGIIANDSQCCFVAVNAGETIGFFMGFLDTYYFGNTKTSYDLLIYVDEKHRGGSTGVKLLQCYIKWARDHGVTDNNIRLGDSAEIDSEAVGRLYKHMGFREHGKLYVLGG